MLVFGRGRWFALVYKIWYAMWYKLTHFEEDLLGADAIAVQKKCVIKMRVSSHRQEKKLVVMLTADGSSVLLSSSSMVRSEHI
ncbi:hypothetical protein EMCRGX_G018589 [Ephydatia muelleri]